MLRLTPHKVRDCSADSWRRVLVAINQKTEDVIIPRADLEDVIQCHRRASLHHQEFPIVWARRTKICINRMVLFNFVQEHGSICGRRECA